MAQRGYYSRDLRAKLFKIHSLEKKHGKGKALTVLAHKLARAVYHMLKRTTAFDREKFLRSYGRGAGEPAA